jgi:hypothetical protein
LKKPFGVAQLRRSKICAEWLANVFFSLSSHKGGEGWGEEAEILFPSP